MQFKKKKKTHKRKRSMQRNNSLINVAKDKKRVTKRTRMPTKRASVVCGGTESGKIGTKERGRGKRRSESGKDRNHRSWCPCRERKEEGKTEWSRL